ncbi:MAG: glycoside hydrolase domain-containing protein, partial [Butyrivibrio sp.]
VLTLSESAAIAQAGLKRVSIFQNSATSYGYFTVSQARNDASTAISLAKARGQTAYSTIYFAVDYDASASNIAGGIKEYFSELNTLIDRGGYCLGVYGSSLVCKTLKAQNIVDYTWLSMATGWGYGTTFDDWDIWQKDTITISGVQFDTDYVKSLTSIGAW